MTVVIALRTVVRPIQRTLQGALFTTLLFWNRLTGGTLKSEADDTFFFFLAQLWMAPSSHVLTTSPYHNIDPSVDVRRHLSSSVPARLPQRSLHTCDTRLFFCVFACYYKSFKETERHIIMALRCDSYLNIYENEKQILQNHSIPNTLMPR